MPCHTMYNVYILSSVVPDFAVLTLALGVVPDPVVHHAPARLVAHAPAEHPAPLISNKQGPGAIISDYIR